MTDEQRQVVLENRVRASRAILLQRSRALGDSVRETLDPFGPVRRDPFGGVVAAVAAGMLLGALTKRSASGSQGVVAAASQGSSTMALIGKLIPAMGSLILPLLRRHDHDNRRER